MTNGRKRAKMILYLFENTLTDYFQASSTFCEAEALQNLLTHCLTKVGKKHHRLFDKIYCTLLIATNFGHQNLSSAGVKLQRAAVANFSTQLITVFCSLTYFRVKWTLLFINFREPTCQLPVTFLLLKQADKMRFRLPLKDLFPHFNLLVFVDLTFNLQHLRSLLSGEAFLEDS